ncbi:MAG TPA: sigma-70 family RNA polymerase sigma factor [Pseudonocardia sp.]|jgi:RNA polymerase sigma-70 factor, ECF subfamily|nr:sigma-70 family RNA polymerase sigma factor [Pseudonocardia sp.]
MAAPRSQVAAPRTPAAGGEETDLRDENGLRAAHRAHADELYRLALRRLGDRGAAEDVVQEVFLRAWRCAADFDPRRSTLRTWLFTIARNLLVDHARRRAVRPVLPVAGEQLAELAGGDRGFDEATMNAWSVEEALRRLSEEHRVALVETYLRGRPYAEVAGELGIPVGTLRSRVFYGLKALRLVLDEMGVQL